MVALNINVAVIHTPSRPIPRRIDRALDSVSRTSIFTDTNHLGAAWNHRRAIMWAAMFDIPTVIVEDDAIPTRHLSTKLRLAVDDWMTNSDTGILSLYLGMGAPVDKQPTIKHMVETAEAHHWKSVDGKGLYHAVAYIIRPGDILAHVSQRLQEMELAQYTAADYTIGSLVPGHMVTYTIPSLFDHDDSMPSSVMHKGPRPTVPRVAWRFDR